MNPIKKKEKWLRRKILPGVFLVFLLLAGCAGNEALNAERAQVFNTWESTETVQSSGDAEGEGILTVTFLDVGQGNAVLVENDGLFMLIDGGDRDDSSYVVSRLKKQGVEELDYVVSSHYDADHLNGVVGALNAFVCDTVLAADYTADTRVYQSFLSVTEEKNIRVEYPDMGEVYSFGDAEFTIVCPDAYDYSDGNDNSIGVRIVHGDNSFLICGDAGDRVEQVMMQSGLSIASDVYLASHHGSAGSSSYEFLEAVSPEAVVISAGLSNSYGHPAESVLSNIQKLGADLYRTDLQGEISVESDGKDLFWNVEPCTDYRSGAGLLEDVSEGESGEKPEQKEVQEGAAPDSAPDGKQTPEEAPDSGQPDGSGELGEEKTYILNRNTKKFHDSDCSSAAEIKEENKAEFTGNRSELIDAGYSACGRCRP